MQYYDDEPDLPPLIPDFTPQDEGDDCYDEESREFDGQEVLEGGTGGQPPENEQCIICYYDFDTCNGFRAVVPCDCTHDLLCAICAMRLRMFSKKPACPTCKRDWKDLIFTKKKGMSYSDYNLPSMVRDGEINVCFDSHDDREYFRRARGMLCSICEEDGNILNPFSSIKSLAEHMERYHRTFFCFTCAEHQQVFPMEMELFPSKKSLQHHITKGSSPNSKRGSSDPHVKCPFCGIRFYGNDQLFQHLEEAHYSCYLCRRHGSSYYEKNIRQLENHFRKKHFLCEAPQCMADQNFAVFDTELELNAHRLGVHGKELSSAEKRVLQRVDLNFGVSSVTDRRRNESSNYASFESDSKFDFPALSNHRVYPHERMPLPGSGLIDSRGSRLDNFPPLRLTADEQKEREAQHQRLEEWRASGRILPQRQQRKAGDVPPFPDLCPSSEMKARNTAMLQAIRKVLVTDQQFKKFRNYSSEFRANKMSVKTYYQHFLNLFGGQKDKITHILIQLVSLLPDRNKAQQLYNEHAAVRKKPFRANRNTNRRHQEPETKAKPKPQRKASPSKPKQQAKPQTRPKAQKAPKNVKQWAKKMPKNESYESMFPATLPSSRPNAPPARAGTSKKRGSVEAPARSNKTPPGFSSVARGPPPGFAASGPPPGLPRQQKVQPPKPQKVQPQKQPKAQPQKPQKSLPKPQPKSQKPQQKSTWSVQKKHSSSGTKIARQKAKRGRAERKFDSFKETTVANDSEKEAIWKQYSTTPEPTEKKKEQQNDDQSKEEIRKKLERLRNESQADNGLGTTIDDLNIDQQRKEKKEKELEKQKKREARIEKLAQKEKEKAKNSPTPEVANGVKNSKKYEKTPVSHDHSSDPLRSLRSRNRYDIPSETNTSKKSKPKKSSKNALLSDNNFPELSSEPATSSRHENVDNSRHSDEKSKFSVDDAVGKLNTKILSTDFKNLRCGEEARHRLDFLLILCSFIAETIKDLYRDSKKPENKNVKNKLRIHSPYSSEGRKFDQNIRDTARLVPHYDHLESVLNEGVIGKLKGFQIRNVRSLSNLVSLAYTMSDLDAMHMWIEQSLTNFHIDELYLVYMYLEVVLLSYFKEQSKPRTREIDPSHMGKNMRPLHAGRTNNKKDEFFRANTEKSSGKKNKQKKKKGKTLLHFG